MDQSSVLINLQYLGLRVEDSMDGEKALSTFPDFGRFAQDVDLLLTTRRDR